MPRGPYQGTWQQGVRPTVVQAPDAMVFINGEADILGCGTCRRRFDWNKYITSIQVDLNIDSPPGSASISLSLPRHSVDEFYTDGNPLITPMMEVEIYAKGAFTIEGLPQYYPIFWGLITEVSDSYSGGEHTFSINCSDILKWWEVCMMNINPAFTAPQGAGQLGRSLFGNVLQGSNPYDVIWHMAQNSFGDIVVGSGSLVSLYKEGQQRRTFNTALADLMGYWESRFTKIRSNLMLYGTSGNVVRGDVLIQKFLEGGKENLASSAVRKANGGKDGAQIIYDPTDPAVVAMRTQFSQAGEVNFWTSEYQTKLEIANTAKEAIGFEFYMDVTGDIVFKPPFYNLDILSNKPVSWIQDIDIIDWDLSESEAEVVTQLQIQGSFGGNTDFGFGEETTPFTSVTDYHLLRKYGWRTQSIDSEFLGAPILMFYVGLDMIDRLNARRHRGTVNIPLRPELRLGFPIYLAPKDQVWYVQGISHNIQFGSRAQTTLSLTAKRTKFLAPKGIGTINLIKGGGPQQNNKDGKPLAPQEPRPTSRQLQSSGVFQVNVGDAAQLPPTNYPEGPDENNPYAPLLLRHPKTGRVVGYPNVVLAYTRPFQPTPAELRKVAGQSPTSKRSDYPEQYVKKINENKQLVQDQLQQYYAARKASGVWEKHNVNRYTYGLNSAGVYMYLHDKSYNNGGVIRDVLIMPTRNIEVEGQDGQKPFEGANAMIRPVSDERGFEVIGHHRYGRGVSLRDGSLVLTKEGTNTRASIATQVALSGSLYDMLKAQSSGLATISTTAPNPVKAIVGLQPEDLQTAGVINPDTKSPEWVSTAENFVDVAPLGSPEQKGAAVGVGNVEASQLSRALTIAEMGVREGLQGGGKCSCLTGRPDLAFISTGFQVKTVRATPEDTTTIGFGAEAGEADREAAEGEIDSPAGDAAVELLEALQEGTPVAGDALAMTREGLTDKVEGFLTTLYTALDTPHQEYEQAIRGEIITRQNPTEVPVDVMRFGLQDDSSFEPPFGQMGRARGGDPAAFAREGSTAIKDIEKSWDEFGKNMSNWDEIADLKIKIQEKRLEIANLKAVEVPLGGGQEEIDRLEQEIADLEKKIQDLLAE